VWQTSPATRWTHNRLGECDRGIVRHTDRAFSSSREEQVREQDGSKFSSGPKLASHDLAASKEQQVAYCAQMLVGSTASFNIDSKSDLYTSRVDVKHAFRNLDDVLSVQYCAPNLIGPSFGQ
jgi:hypothetical protein